MNKVIIKNAAEIETMREGGRRLANVVDRLKASIYPGMTALDLDKIAEEGIRSFGDTPAFKGYRGFPATLCLSLNDEVVHGIPRADRIINEGDLVSMDIGLIHEKYYSDMAVTVAVGKVSSEAKNLMEVTEKSLYLAIDQIKVGSRLGVIGSTVQKFVEDRGYGVVRDLVGHGIGRTLHEDPPVPNFGNASAGPLLASGMTIAIEPMITLGDYHVTEDKDNWTIRTKDGSLSAHFEHSVVVTENGAEILTLL